MTMADRIHNLTSRVMRTALPASAMTTAAVAICGHADADKAIAPLNAVSHIVWGDVAARQEDVSVQFTATGIALNTVAVASWALIYELFFGKSARKGNTSAAVLGGIAVSWLAYVTDYYVVPKRLTPGFEKRLSPASMLIVYSVLAASLPLTALWERHTNSRG